jgi:hypothetical protein
VGTFFGLEPRFDTTVRTRLSRVGVLSSGLLRREMDVGQLRSQLQHSFPDDFKNLTTSDLKECKWKIQSQIWTTMILSSQLLFTYHEPLNSLNEKRSRALENLRNRTDAREFKRHTEEEYKHQFIEIILNICIEFNFPPAVVPFSNPLQSFYEDSNFVLQAIGFVLEGIVGSNSNHRQHRYDRPVSSSVPTTPSNTISTPEELKTTPRKSPISKSLSRPPTGRSVEEILVPPPPPLDDHMHDLHTMGDYQSLFQSFQVSSLDLTYLLTSPLLSLFDEGSPASQSTTHQTTQASPGLPPSLASDSQSN